MRKFREKIYSKIFWGENVKILRKKYEREIINYDIIKLLMLSSQSKELKKFLHN